MKKALNTKEAAYYISLSESTLRQGRMNGQRRNRCPTPPFLKLGRKIVYLQEDLDRFLEKQRINPHNT